MEIYNSLTKTYNKLLSSINTSHTDIKNKIINLKLKNYNTFIISKTELKKVDLGNKKGLNTELNEYFDIFKNYDFYNTIKKESLIHRIEDLDINIINIINSIFQEKNTNDNIKKYKDLISQNLKKLDENNKYLFFRFYEINNDTFQVFNEEKLLEYFIYNELNLNNVSSEDLIINIKKIEINDNVNKLLESINYIFRLISQNELINYGNFFNKLDLEFNNLLSRRKSLNQLIEEDINKINDTNFFHFLLSSVNLESNFNEIIEFIDIKKNKLEKSDNYESFLTFYNIVLHINSKIDDIELKLDNFFIKESNIEKEIISITNKIKKNDDDINKLNKKKRNNNNRNNKINLIINSHNNNDDNYNYYDNDNYEKYNEEVIKKISNLNCKINVQLKKNHKLNLELKNKVINIQDLMDKLNKFKNEENLLYDRYKKKIEEEDSNKLKIINSINDINQELKFNKKNLKLLNELLNQNPNTNTKNINKFQIDIKEIDNKISDIKKNEEITIKNNTDLIKKKNELDEKQKNIQKEIFKLKEDKRELENDLYHNQVFLRKKFKKLFTEKYNLDNIKSILKSLVTNIEKKEKINDKIGNYFGSKIIIDQLESNYIDHNNFYKNIKYKLNKIKDFKSLSFNANDKYQNLFLKLIEEIIPIFDIIYKFRFNYHNYFNLYTVKKYLSDKFDHRLIEDIDEKIHSNYILQDLVEKEELNILYIKSKIKNIKNKNFENQQNAKKKLLEKTYNKLATEMSLYNDFKKENLKVLKLKKQLLLKKEKLDSIYNYLISSI